jgi:Chlamydia polymorphic membrane protein (Chlamydia_PMP) repeat
MLRTSLPRLWKHLFGGKNRLRTVNRKPRSVRLNVENLEDRQVPSTLTWNVTSNADPAVLTPGTLRYAVTEANNYALVPGNVGVIQIASGLQPILLKEGQLELTKGTGQVTINGDGVSVSGNKASRVFQVDPGANAVFSGLTIEYGNESGTQVGGGILNQGNLAVNDCNLVYDWAYNGGAIYNTGSLTVSTGSVFEDNNAASIGGAICNFGTLNVSGQCFFGANNSNDWGGAIFNDGNATLTNSTISSGNQINGNTAVYGGGIFNESSLTLNINDCTISGNSATYGGGIYNEGLVTVNASLISGNHASQDGGGIVNTVELTVENGSYIYDNGAAGYGGGIMNETGATAKVYNSTISYNSAALFGGGIYNDYGTVSWTATNIANNFSLFMFGANVYTP